jgi:ABC-type uncharacterized transport system substrate-binding protein
MRRRQIVVLLGGMVAAPLVLGWSATVDAQQARVYRIGVLLHGGVYFQAIDGLRDGLRTLGLTEGRDYVLLIRDSKGDVNSVGPAASRLEAENVDLIYTVATSVTRAAKRATSRVPIVFYAGTDPVALGLVESYAKPGGRVTGVHSRFTGLTGKRMELLKEMVPTMQRILTFYNPNHLPAQRSAKLAREAARELNLELIERPVPSVEELRKALVALRPGAADAYLYVSDAMVSSQAELLINTATANRLPTMFQERWFVAKGALAAYGESYYRIGRISAKHVERILLGTDPKDLPVEQSNRPTFTVSLRTAKALGLEISQSILLRADEVLE